MKRLLTTVVLATVFCSVQPHIASAQDDAAMPEVSEASLAAVQKKAEAEPKNLDAWFDYARVALALDKKDEAEKAYRHMLSVRPDLPRVKLDLALLMIRLERYEEAKTLLNEVKASNPPEAVIANIDTVMKGMEQMSRKHIVGGAVVIGLNKDSNANASPTAGQIQLGSLNIPLEDSTRAQRDWQKIAAANLGYTYRGFDTGHENVKLAWKNSGTAYMADQDELDNLDIELYGATTGLEMQQTAWGLTLGLDAGYNQIVLDDAKYLTVASLTASSKYALTQKLMLSLDATTEDRNFFNTDTVSVYRLRTGHANQAKFGLMFAGSDKDMLSADITLRRENTGAEYYDNEQTAYSLGYTRIFTPTLMGNAGFTWRDTTYDGVEAVIDPDTIREDVEKTASVSLARQFPDWGVTWSVNYQFRDVASNIINYEYKNHRVGTSVAYSF